MTLGPNRRIRNAELAAQSRLFITGNPCVSDELGFRDVAPRGLGAILVYRLSSSSHRDLLFLVNTRNCLCVWGFVERCICSQAIYIYSHDRLTSQLLIRVSCIPPRRLVPYTSNLPQIALFSPFSHPTPTPLKPPHKLLFAPRSTFPSHSATNPLIFSGASHNAQCPVLTSFLVKWGISPSMPSDRDGGKASSFVAWIKRTGTLMILLVSLYQLGN